jgi:flavin reductase (DIM6/NTAB) family NADH-FMN oxidoreductase RutF
MGEVTAIEFRQALGHFLTGVTVATTCGPAGEPVGMTVSAFMSASLDPPLVLLSVARSAASFAAMDSARRYAVHILREDQRETSAAFARSAADGADKFAAIAWSRAEDGLPLLDDHLARLECTIIDRVALGDHVGYVGRVDSARVADGSEPLVYFRGGYASLSAS